MLVHLSLGSDSGSYDPGGWSGYTGHLVSQAVFKIRRWYTWQANGRSLDSGRWASVVFQAGPPRITDRSAL